MRKAALGWRAATQLLPCWTWIYLIPRSMLQLLLLLLLELLLLRLLRPVPALNFRLCLLSAGKMLNKIQIYCIGRTAIDVQVIK